jgi:uncharacterized protein (TIGR02118 family)
MPAQLLVIYPPPSDSRTFERRYREEHLPYAGPRLKGATAVVTKRVVAAPGAAASPYWVSVVQFPSRTALEECAATPGAQEALQHAASISSGGMPQFLLVEDVDLK